MGSTIFSPCQTLILSQISEIVGSQTALVVESSVPHKINSPRAEKALAVTKVFLCPLEICFPLVASVTED